MKAAFKWGTGPFVVCNSYENIKLWYRAHPFVLLLALTRLLLLHCSFTAELCYNSQPFFWNWILCCFCDDIWLLVVVAFNATIAREPHKNNGRGHIVNSRYDWRDILKFAFNVMKHYPPCFKNWIKSVISIWSFQKGYNSWSSHFRYFVNSFTFCDNDHADMSVNSGIFPRNLSGDTDFPHQITSKKWWKFLLIVVQH